MSDATTTAGKLQVLAKSWWPRHLLADIARLVVDSRRPWLKKAVIRYFLARHTPDMQEALVEDPFAYPSFNAFFSRALKPQARPVCTAAETLVAPVDGRVSQFGQLTEGRLLQAKGRDYSLQALLADAYPRNAQLLHGSWITLYLAPEDYHRVHMPLDGRLLYSTHVPGRLFSVAAHSVQHVDQLYARNERLICEFESAIGNFALVLVGAGFVSGIETRWRGLLQRGNSHVHREDHRAANRHFAKGEELALFRMGSTVLVLLPEGAASWNSTLQVQQRLRMGERIATLAHMENKSVKQ